MRHQFTKATTLATIAVAIASTASAQTVSTEVAPPNCGLTGKWSLTGTLIQLPNNGPNQGLSCTIILATNGTYKGDCVSFIPGQPKVIRKAEGTIKADAVCGLSGTIISKPQANSTIAGGSVNGNVATFVAYRGNSNAPEQVRHVTLIRAK